MRKFLIGFVVIAVAILGGMWWLGQQAVKNPPPDVETRIPVEGVFQ
ncbi:MAG: YdgA family protein [Hyphomonas sp.]|jgi:hypothetical protein|nr:YdgA family protein [Hyphomonas sp.]